MNLLPAARLTLILCTALAAAALYLAGDSAAWLTVTLVAGGMALLLLDRLRWVKPIPSALGFLPILVAAGIAAWEWLAGGPSARSAADACVHFILLCQIAAILSDLSGPQVGMCLAGSVILLLVSVKNQPHPGHLPLLILLLLAATAGLVFRVALGRQNEFQAMAQRTQRNAENALIPADRRFALRMSYITLVLTVLAAGFGVSAFLFFPRISFAAVPPPVSQRAGNDPSGPLHPQDPNLPAPDIELGGGDGEDGTGAGGVAGFEENVSLRTFGQIIDSPGMALKLMREKIDVSKPLPGAMLYLRGQTSTHYENGRWSNHPLPEPQQLLPFEDNRWLLTDFEKDRNQVLGGGVFELVGVHDYNAAQSKILFIPGAAGRLDKRNLPGPVWRHANGAIRVAGGIPDNYRFLCQIAQQPLQPADAARCAHPFSEMTGISLRLRPELLEMAGRAVGNARTDQAKALAIAQFLRESGEFSYTLDLPAMPKNADGRPRYNDPIELFLFESKKGHCACFATAFVILARLNRLPARLATGYAVRANFDQTEMDVPASAAHAWAELYLADQGWLTVDPTPAGAGAAALAARHAASGGGPIPADSPNALDADPTQADPAAPLPLNDPLLNYSAQSQNQLYQTLMEVLLYPLLPLPGLTLRLWHLLALLTVVAVAVFVRRRMTIDEYLETIDGVAVRALRPRIVFYRRMLAIMKSRGHARRPSQSATEYAQMLAHRKDAAARSVQTLTDLYLLLRFGLLDEARRKTVWASQRTAVQEHLKQLEALSAAEKSIAAATEG